MSDHSSSCGWCGLPAKNRDMQPFRRHVAKLWHSVCPGGRLIAWLVVLTGIAAMSSSMRRCPTYHTR